MHYFHSQALFTWYYDWWSHLIISQVGIIFEQVLSGSVVCWLGTLQYLYVTLLDHADVGFLPPQHFITLNPHAFAGATAFFDIQNIKNSLGNASDPTALWHSNLLQDTNFWKLDTYSSLHQVSKKSSLHQACLACLMPDAVSIPPGKVNLRFIVVANTDIFFIYSCSQQLATSKQGKLISSLPFVFDALC